MQFMKIANFAEKTNYSSKISLYKMNVKYSKQMEKFFDPKDLSIGFNL